MTGVAPKIAARKHAKGHFTLTGEKRSHQRPDVRLGEPGKIGIQEETHLATSKSDAGGDGSALAPVDGKSQDVGALAL